MYDSTLVRKAYLFAANAHWDARQDRNGYPAPYLVHPLDVVGILRKHGVVDETSLAIALLHDTVEDCPQITMEMIQEQFPKEVVLGVDWMTKRPTEKDVDYFARMKTAPLHIRNIKLADRVSNLMSMMNYPKQARWYARYQVKTQTNFAGWIEPCNPGLVDKLKRLMIAPHPYAKE